MLSRGCPDPSEDAVAQHLRKKKVVGQLGRHGEIIFGVRHGSLSLRNRENPSPRKEKCQLMLSCRKEGQDFSLVSLSCFFLGSKFVCKVELRNDVCRVDSVM